MLHQYTRWMLRSKNDEGLAPNLHSYGTTDVQEALHTLCDADNSWISC
jgi:hypothetical protein